jgi:preprotein translocase subunit SecE
MGRLQRKKPSESKKKKKQTADESVSGPEGKGSAAIRLPQSAGLAGGGKKKQLAATRTEPGRIKKYIDQAVQFLREVRVELKKVTWPSRKQTMGSTVVVIILVTLIALFLGVVDMGLSSLVRVVLQ